jgi:hypothetical protein
MTYTYKLSRRLAVLRALMLVMGAVWTAACTDDEGMGTFAPSPDSLRRPTGGIVTVKVVPDSQTLEVNQSVRFAGYGVNWKGDSVWVTLGWSASGGSIGTDGLFSASQTGKFKVIGKTGGKRQMSDTAIVIVVPPQPSVVEILVTPDTATVAAGKTRTFSAVGELSDSSTAPIGVQWNATGGTIDPSGVYKAGSNPGSYRVIAKNLVGTLADTSEVTIPEPPAPTLAQVILAPATASLGAGGTQQFAAYGRTSVGDSVPVSVAFAATGGSINSNGLYTAGSTGGTFRVSATQSGGILADTSSVTITSAVPPPPPPPETHTGWQVTPNGTSGNQGTAASPWSLSHALSGAGGTIRPGDTVWVRAGTYTGSWYTTVAGTASAPVIIRAYPGERARLNGAMQINGGYVWYWGLEVSNTSSTIGEVTGINIYHPGVKLINMVVSGWTENGIGSWQGAPGNEITGTLVYNNGWKASSGCHYGHGIYFNSETGAKLFRDNIIFDQMAFGFHGYTVNGSLRNVTAKGNAVFDNGASGVCGTNVLIGGDAPVDNLTFDSNYVYKGSGTANGALWLGYNGQSVNSRVRDNLVGNTFLRLYNWSSGLTVSGNQISNAGQLTDMSGNWAGMMFSGNRWLGNGGAEFYPSGQTFTQWKATTGAQDTYTTAQPSGQQVIVRPNPYEPGRAHVIVYNWSGGGSVTVSVPGLAGGRAYEVRNAQRFWDAPVTSGSYGGSITIPLASVTPYPAPIGWPAGGPSSGNQFHVFVVVPR